MTSRHRSFTAYTLVEMLVVLAIVAILSALLFTVFSRVREKARATHCQSNLRQLGIAFQQYTADNGRFPLWYNAHLPSTPLPNSFAGLPWAIRIGSYIKENSLFRCPSDGTEINPNPVISSSESGFSSYGYQLGLGDLTDAEIGHPAEVMVLFDSGSGPAYNANLNSSSPPAPEGAGDRHSGGSNFLFADGHVKWVAVNQGRDYEIVR